MPGRATCGSSATPSRAWWCWPRGNKLTLDNLPATLDADPLLDSNRVTVSTTSLVDLQRAAVEKALADCNGHRTRAAESLGISVRTLQRKLKAWGMERETVAAAALDRLSESERGTDFGSAPGPFPSSVFRQGCRTCQFSTNTLSTQPQLTDLLDALTACVKGKRGVRLPIDWTGVAGKVADAFNDVVELNERMAGELGRLSRVVGKEGKLGQRLSLGKVDGFWDESVESVNELIDDLVHPTSETARVIGAVAQGDLSQNDGPGSRRPAAAGRVPADRPHDQPDGRSAQLVRLAK